MKFTQAMSFVDLDELPALALGEHFVIFKQQYEAYDYNKSGVVLWNPGTPGARKKP